jgi:hypothetical protein
MFLPSAFPTPALGMEGNLGRNTFRNENLINVNFTFGKSFSLPWFAGDKMKFEARGEVLNLFNRVNASGLDGNMNDGTFGEATGQFQTRQLQMHLPPGRSGGSQRVVFTITRRPITSPFFL